jgi:glycosyltransferase involved in cell wall biosynthesis
VPRTQRYPPQPDEASTLRHAVFIAFHYPPEASSSGVLRTLKYTRYLPEHGWRVSVITPEASTHPVRDAKLESQISAETRVIRTRAVNTKRDLSVFGRYPALLALPDAWIGWMPFAIAAGRQLVRRDPVDLVYSTSPHATAHLIARRIASIARTPWVTDFRDPWIEDPPEPGAPNGPIFRTVNRWLERRVVARSDIVITSTSHLRDVMRLRYPDEPSEKFRTILNGYDEEDFKDLRLTPSATGARLRIVHAGNINAQYRDPRPFFDALARAARDRRISSAELEIRFIGGGEYGDAPELRAAVASAGLTDSVVFLPRVPYEESLRELSEADLLLLLQASDDTVGLVPAKLYEYLRTGKPVLALVLPGAVTEVLARTGGGWCTDPGDSTSLDATLAQILQQWRDTRLATHAANMTELRRFERRVLTGELAGIFDTLCRTHGT